MITRPGDEGLRAAETARARGIEAHHHPAIEIEILPPPSDRDALLVGVDRLLITSVNALRGFFGAGRAPRSIPTWAVGESTASAARGFGLEVVLVGGGDGLAALCQVIARREILTGLRVLWPHGDRADSAPLEPLRALGAVVQGLVVYRTVSAYRFSPPPARLLDRFTHVEFTSPSAVEALFEILTPSQVARVRREATWDAIGPTTAAACRRYFGDV